MAKIGDTDRFRGLSVDEIDRLGQVVLAEVFEFSVARIRKLAGAAGLDASKIPSKSEERTGQGSHAEVRPAVQRLFAELSPELKANALFILADRVLAEGNADERKRSQLRLSKLLSQHGFQFIEGAFIPVDLLDERERRFLPDTSYAHIAAAFRELTYGNDSSAITKACGAVDSLTQTFYQEKNWGKPPIGFKEKVTRCLNELRVFEGLEAEFLQLPTMTPSDAQKMIKSMREATESAAEALQVLRRTMGDVHGTKPAYRKSAYDAIKWASAICGLLEGHL